jgi:hypothetical protein
MRLLLAIGTAVLALTIVAPAYAQQEQHEQKEEEKAKPEQEKEKKAQPEKPANQAERERGKPDEKAAQQHAQPAQHGAKGGGRIPDDRYRADFGRQHSFRVSEGDYRNHRFQYGGYWFGFADPWPNNWLYTQDVYVREIGGVYYLCNAAYPGVNIALTVTL